MEGFARVKGDGKGMVQQPEQWGQGLRVYLRYRLSSAFIAFIIISSCGSICRCCIAIHFCVLPADDVCLFKSPTVRGGKHKAGDLRTNGF